MERPVLFDGGCTLCTGLALDIERATHGWLTARSLRDPAMTALLDQARPGWRWEPTLVEVNGERVRVVTGIKMRSRLVVGLGPKRAVRVAQLVQQALAPKPEVDQGRRTLLKRGAMLAGLLVVGPKLSLPQATSPNTISSEDSNWLAHLNIQKSEELTGVKLHEAIQQFSTAADTQQLADVHRLDMDVRSWGLDVQDSATDVQGNQSIDTDRTKLRDFKAVRHTLEGGNSLLSRQYWKK